jgi:hypothetical protein
MPNRFRIETNIAPLKSDTNNNKEIVVFRACTSGGIDRQSLNVDEFRTSTTINEQ